MIEKLETLSKKIPNVKMPLVDVNTDPLDALLYGLGIRLVWLAKERDDKFVKLVGEKQVVIAFESDSMARTYHFNGGRFHQASEVVGQASEADLTIKFVDSLTGVKLLTKGDLASIMTAVQDGKMSVTGDYKLLMWFVSLAKHAVSVPKKYEPYIAKIKPCVNKVRGFFKK